MLQDDNADTQERLLQRLAAFAAYQQLQQGSVHNAMAIAKRYCPAVLEVSLGAAMLPLCGSCRVCGGPCWVSLFT